MTRIARSDTFMFTYVSAFSMRVGGSVRDQLLGRDPKDADYYVPKLSLAELEKALWDAFKIAGYTERVSVKPLKLRTQTQVGWRAAARGLGSLEIVLPRREVSTGPTRQDFEIVIDPDLSIEVDALRRDFTFNALYLPAGTGDDAMTALDPTGTGLYDLEHKLIRTTHSDSFRDDPLRTLRALRFVSTLGYDMTPDTLAQMEEHADAVTGLTTPKVEHARMDSNDVVTSGGYASGTVLEELRKLLMGEDAVKALRIMRDTGVMAVLLPELAPMIGFDQASRYHTYTTDEHTFAALDMAVKVDAPLRVRMALLFHDSGKPATAWMDRRGRKHYYAAPENGNRNHAPVGAEITEATLSRLGSTRDFRKDVTTIVREHMLWNRPDVKDSEVGRLRVKLGDSLLRDLILHRMCDACGKRKADAAQLAYFQQLELRRQEFEKMGVPCATSELQIRGRDMLDLGAVQEDIGRILRTVLDEVVCQPDEKKLSREWQLDRAEALL